MACSGAHHWGRQFQKMGHTVKLLPATKVKHRTAQINSIRGLLKKFGLVMPQAFEERLPDCLVKLEKDAPSAFMCALQVQVK